MVLVSKAKTSSRELQILRQGTRESEKLKLDMMRLTSGTRVGKVDDV